MTRAFRRPFYIIAALVWAALAYVLVYWQWLDNSPVYYNENIVAESPAHRGGILVLNSSFCQRGDIIPGTVIRSIQNTFIYILADSAAVSPAGCYTTYREIQLPTSLVPGPHTYNFSAQFRVNPIKVMAGAIRPVPFDVVP